METTMMPESNHPGQPVGLALKGWVPPPLPSCKVMRGRFCRLEPLNVAEHSRNLFITLQDDGNGRDWTYLPYGPFLNLDMYREWMKSSCLGNDPLFFAVVDPATGKATGVASYLRIKPDSGSIEVGHIHFSPGLQKTIAATEAMYLMMQHAFGLGYRRYEWKCNALNIPSRSAAQRLGLSFEGVSRQHMIAKGRNRDTAWYAVIDAEWNVLQSAFETWLSPGNFDEAGKQRTRLSELTAPILKKKG